MSKRSRQLALLAVVAAAAALRLRYLQSGVPLAVEIDEPVIVDRALAIMSTGNWHPRGFDYPSLVIYLQTVVNIAEFLKGAVQGLWPSLDRYSIASAYEAGRAVSALIGTATVWLTYRLGKEVESPAIGLVAAAQLAVYPMHVRESHFVLTDSPATALATLALLLTVRALRVGTLHAYVSASAAAGLAAAAKYNAGVVAVVLPVAWLLGERHSATRRWSAAAILIVTPLAFLVTVPYAVIDLPGFLTGLGGQVGRFSARSLATGDDAPWRVYLTHLSLASRLWLPLAAIGLILLILRRRHLARWAIPVAFLAAYYYVLSTHGIVFGRYALPLLPALCLLVAVPLVELGRRAAGLRGDPRIGVAVTVAAAAVVLAPLTSGSLQWLQEFHRTDTREIAGRWMMAAAPGGTKIVVENSGPTNLNHLGFTVLERPNHLDDPPEAYGSRGAEYLLLATFSEADLRTYDRIIGAGRLVFSVDPGGSRWGPYIRTVKLEGPR